MRILMFVILSALSQLSHAGGGAWDGIYSCSYNVAGYVYNVYVTINGYPDGRSIFAVAAVTTYTPFYGYGIGTISGNVFSGSTMLGLPFHATATPSGFTGTIATVVSGQTINASGSCLKVW